MCCQATGEAQVAWQPRNPNILLDDAAHQYDRRIVKNNTSGRMIIRITKCGKVIGRIIPEGKYLEKRMVDLVKQGVIYWGGKPLTPWNPIARNKGPALLSDLVYDERRRI